MVNSGTAILSAASGEKYKQNARWLDERDTFNIATQTYSIDQKTTKDERRSHPMVANKP
jgi:hypothetical protein